MLLLRPYVEALHVYLQRHESREGCEGRVAHRAPLQQLHVDFPAAEAGFRNPIHRGDRVCCVLFSVASNSKQFGTGPEVLAADTVT